MVNEDMELCVKSDVEERRFSIDEDGILQITLTSNE